MKNHEWINHGIIKTDAGLYYQRWTCAKCTQDFDHFYQQETISQAQANYKISDECKGALK
jgi:hypothetical protein